MGQQENSNRQANLDAEKERAAGRMNDRSPEREAIRDAKGYPHNAFKIGLARRTIVRALTQAAQGTPQSQSDKRIL